MRTYAKGVDMVIAARVLKNSRMSRLVSVGELGKDCVSRLPGLTLPSFFRNTEPVSKIDE